MRKWYQEIIDHPMFPVYFRKVNGWATWIWLALIPICYAAGLLSSVVFVSALSLYAIVTGHAATWQAARVEARQEADDTEQMVREIRETQKDDRVART